MPRGYEEGPVAEEAERRRDELRRGVKPEKPDDGRPAVFGCTAEDASPHFIGWADEVDPDELFESGRAWGLTVRRIRAA